MSSDAPTPPDDDFPAGQTGDMRDVLLSPPTAPKTPAGPWQPPSAEELQKLLPQYEITALLGRGGMGAVYKGRQIALDRPVAIKILSNTLDEADASFAERFKNEARALGKLSHPGIVGVYDFGEAANGLLYIVMEFIDGTDVARMLSQQKRLHTEHAMAITAHVCDALAYAHERGIIHRDIKPANIMVGYDGVVKVADFGLAKMTHSQNSGLTQSGMAMGTLHYMAPEALMLGSAVDHRADIYAVGVMLYQMLTGKIPQGLFELPSLQVPGLDPRYDSIIGRALREDRDLRYPSVLNMRHDLDAILTQPVVKVEAAAEKAPAALETLARPQRPGGQPYRPPQPQVIVRAEKKGSRLLWVALIAMSGVAGWLFFKDSKSGALPSPKTPPATTTVATRPAVENTPPLSGEYASVTKSAPFVNTLGMKFVPVPGTNVLMCMHETRKSDYAAFAAATPGTDSSWVNPTFVNPTFEGMKVSEGDDHPVVSVNSLDAEAFCRWLSKKEGRSYRLPSWREWGWAVGTGPLEQEGATFAEMKIKVAGIYPWGRGWPPPKDAGNMADEALKARQPTARIIAGYQDGYATTAPVMSFPPNEIGIYDLCGNVNEWCGDITTKGDQRKIRSSSWMTIGPDVSAWSSNPGDGGQALMLRSADLGFRVVLEITSSSASAEAVSKATPLGTPAKAITVETAQTPPMTTAKPAEVVVKESVPLTLPTGPTTWIDTKNRSITATFKAIASGNVLLDIAGKVTPVPLNTLSAESQKLARDYQQQTPPAAATKEAPFVNTLGMKFVPVPIDEIAQEPSNGFDRKNAGRRVLNDIPFDFTNPSRCFLSQSLYKPASPTSAVLKVNVPTPAAVCVLINGAGGAALEAQGTEIGHIKLGFADGSAFVAPLKMGIHLRREAWLSDSTHPTTPPGDEIIKVTTGIIEPQFRGQPAKAFMDMLTVKLPAAKATTSLTSITFADTSVKTASDFSPGFQVYAVTVQKASAASSDAAPSSSSVSATKDAPFINTLGMKFVPVPGTRTLFCIHETRRQDYMAYAAEVTNVDNLWKDVRRDGIPCGDKDDHPVVGVSWEDAQKFCAWLSKKEGKNYRLPTDAEWSTAVGLKPEQRPRGTTPETLSGRETSEFPWNGDFPPATNAKAGNYGDTAWKGKFPSKDFIQGYTDGFPTTAAVMSFPANRRGLHDMGGNAWEWVEDWWNAAQKERTMRGASFSNCDQESLLSSYRNHPAPWIRLTDIGFRCVIELP